jgi:hypothetical protein
MPGAGEELDCFLRPVFRIQGIWRPQEGRSARIHNPRRASPLPPELSRRGPFADGILAHGPLSPKARGCGAFVATEVIPMQYRLRAIGLLAGAMLALGFVSACEKQIKEAGTTPADPSSKPVSTDVAKSLPKEDATVASATLGKSSKSPETQPLLRILYIDELGAEFPATKLRLYVGDANGSAIRAELFSDLPKSALRKYDGNELYLDMTLQGVVTSGTETTLDNATWRFKSTSSGKANSPNGIFLHGQQTHLQPSDAIVKFDKRDGQLYAQIMGQFRAFEDGTPDALAPFVGVRGELPVEIVQK